MYFYRGFSELNETVPKLLNMVLKSRAAVVPKPSATLEIEEYEIPKLEPGAALLKVANAGVCGTDVHL